MSQYYGESQWPTAGPGQATWDHQTPPPPPPPARSGASSAIPREESTAFSYQIEEVERAIDNLVKSGKMFGGLPRHGRGVSGHGGPRNHSVTDFGDPRAGGHSGPNLQNFYAAQRHQSSRGSNEAEQMMQAKRRMAAQRERELRNYHQEQQYNRNALSDSSSYNGKPDRTLSPGGMSEGDRRDLIARQRSALYGGEGQYVDENSAPRSGAPGLPPASSSLRGPSPLAYDYARGGAPGAGPQAGEGQSRADNASPQSNPTTNLGAFEGAIGQQANRTSNSSPTGGSPPRQGLSSEKPAQSGNAVAPIGTRPSATSQAPNPALNKRSTTPLPSPLSHGFTASNGGEENAQSNQTSGAPSNPPSAAADGYNGWGNRSGVWGNKSSLGVQASVWG
ncbi:hypothetical protein UCREL1_7482 [Eutypa lata UCREL1]|uniref:Uncharacterized protein n=1 Tax=Eutypa lata (strain UCR-EL1) TaxID=1287681 RepID=M7SGX9_EUTLA|nr:hypothetical protein UCREL1_7482 [Eutypa lata UCREL1]